MTERINVSREIVSDEDAVYRVNIGGECLRGLCQCKARANKLVAEIEIRQIRVLNLIVPPFHDGCDCYLTKEEDHDGV